MKLIRIILLSVIATLSISCATGGGNFKVPKHREVKLDNGLTVLFFKDTNLPYFSMNMLVGVGGMHDDEKTLGTASMVAELLDKGTQKRSATEIARDYDNIGASFTASASNEYTLIQTSGLSLHTDILVDSFAEIILQPKFANSEIVRLRKQTIGNIKRSLDDPSSLASKSFRQILMPNYPYGMPISGTLKSVAQIKKRDIMTLYLRHYRPNNATLAVVGNYPDNILEMIKSKFSDWKPRQDPEFKEPKLEPFSGRKMYLVNKPGTQQTQIRMGFYGIKRNNPDFVGIRLATTILGGAFKSRLMDEIRVKRGLSYGASAQMSAQSFRDAFTVSTFTKHETAGKTVDITLDVLEDFYKNGITDEELVMAKGLLKGQFPRLIETAEKLASNVLILRHYGVNEEYLKTYLDKVDSYSKSELNAAIKKYLNPKDIKIVLMTTEGNVISQLKKYNPEVVSYKQFL
ncbi:MAG: pitrilysin family protein [Bdellovibrionales bacterium]